MGSDSPASGAAGLALRTVGMVVAVAAMIASAQMLLIAAIRWRWASRCKWSCPALVDVAYLDEHRRAMDWTHPLLVALALLAVAGFAVVLVVRQGRVRPRP